jgi:hypothetical protein
MSLWQTSPEETLAWTPVSSTPTEIPSRIPIGLGYNAWPCVLPAALAAFCLILAGLFWLIEGRLPIEFPAVLLLWGGGGGIGLAAAAAIGIGYTRRWIEIFDDRFRLIDRRSVCEIRDDQVQAATLYWKSRDFGGDFRGQVRYFSLSLDGLWELDRLAIRTALRPGEHDPLEALIDRITARLHERANETLAERKPLSGAGWTLQRDVLELGDQADRRRIDLDELFAVDRVDACICGWIHGQDVPVVRIPQSTENAWLLERLLEERIPPAVPASVSSPSDRLGRVIFERRLPRGWVCLLFCASVLFALTGLWQIGSALAPAGLDSIRLVVGTVCLLAACATGWAGEFYRRAVFRCHEFGVSETGLFRTQRLLDRDLQMVTFIAARQYIHGVYIGTTFLLSLTPSEDAGQPVITYRRIAPRADEELERLRDRAAQCLAARMAAELAQGRAVEWTETMRLRPEGVEHRPGGLLGRLRSPTIISYDSVTQFDIDDGHFHLWVKYQERAILKVETGKPNFYPGLILLERILDRRG